MYLYCYIYYRHFSSQYPSGNIEQTILERIYTFLKRYKFIFKKTQACLASIQLNRNLDHYGTRELYFRFERATSPSKRGIYTVLKAISSIQQNYFFRQDRYFSLIGSYFVHPSALATFLPYTESYLCCLK